MNTRAIAARILQKVIYHQQSLDDAISHWVKPSFAAEDLSLIKEMSYGTLRWYYRLDFLATLGLRNDAVREDGLVYSLLLVGLYQLNYLRIPDYAAINETAEAARSFRKPWAVGLINAVLRNFLRRKDTLLEKVAFDDVANYSHPKWLLEVLENIWPDQWQMIVNVNNEYPPMHLRVNLLHQSRDQYLAQLKQSNIEANSSELVKSGITLIKPCDVKLIPGFWEGMVSVQDLAAQLAAKVLDLQTGQRVLDACAAPGGKTAHILETEPAVSEVVALDVDQERLLKIAENLTRLHLKASLKCGNAADPKEWWDGKPFDRILLDAPCSGTGVIRRHPDIKILRSLVDIENSAKKQLQLLSALWPLLTIGGRIVYAVCSVMPQETVAVIAKFLQTHNDAEEQKLSVSWGIAMQYGRQILPEHCGPDGFFYAVLIKKTSLR